MKEIYRININELNDCLGKLKTGKNNISNNYSSYLNFYDSDQSIVVIKNKINSVYEEIINGYDKVINWLTSFIDDAENFEKTLGTGTNTINDLETRKYVDEIIEGSKVIISKATSCRLYKNNLSKNSSTSVVKSTSNNKKTMDYGYIRGWQNSNLASKTSNNLLDNNSSLLKYVDNSNNKDPELEKIEEEYGSNTAMLYLTIKTFQERSNELSKLLEEKEKELEKIQQDLNTIKMEDAYGYSGNSDKIKELQDKETKLKEEVDSLNLELCETNYYLSEAKHNYEISKYTSIMDSESFKTFMNSIDWENKLFINNDKSTSTLVLPEDWEYMSDDQLKTYLFYLYYVDKTSSNNSMTSDSFYKLLKGDITKAKGAEAAAKWIEEYEKYGYDEDHPIESIIGFTAQGGKVSAKGIFDGIDSFFDGLKNVVDWNDEVTAEDYERMIIAQYIIEEDIYGGAYKFSSAFGNMLPSIVASAVTSAVATPAAGATVAQKLGPIVGSTLMGLTSFGTNMHEGLVNGNSTFSSFIYGLLTGGSEAILGYFLGKMPFLSKGKSAAALTYKQMAVEFAEEYFKDLFQEGFEELTQEIVYAVCRKICFGEEIDFDSLPIDMRDSFCMGVLMSFVLSGGVTKTKIIIDGITYGVDVNTLASELFNSQGINKELTKNDIKNIIKRIALNKNTSTYSVAELSQMQMEYKSLTSGINGLELASYINSKNNNSTILYNPEITAKYDRIIELQSIFDNEGLKYDRYTDGLVNNNANFQNNNVINMPNNVINNAGFADLSAVTEIPRKLKQYGKRLFGATIKILKNNGGFIDLRDTVHFIKSLGVHDNNHSFDILKNNFQEFKEIAKKIYEDAEVHPVKIYNYLVLNNGKTDNVLREKMHHSDLYEKISLMSIYCTRYIHTDGYKLSTPDGNLDIKSGLKYEDFVKEFSKLKDFSSVRYGNKYEAQLADVNKSEWLYFDTYNGHHEMNHENVRMYIPIANESLFNFTELFLNEVLNENIEVEFKINNFVYNREERSDSFLIYADRDKMNDYVRIINKILDENENIKINEKFKQYYAYPYTENLYLAPYLDSAFTSYNGVVSDLLFDLKKKSDTFEQYYKKCGQALVSIIKTYLKIGDIEGYLGKMNTNSSYNAKFTETEINKKLLLYEEITNRLNNNYSELIKAKESGENITYPEEFEKLYNKKQELKNDIENYIKYGFKNNKSKESVNETDNQEAKYTESEITEKLSRYNEILKEFNENPDYKFWLAEIEKGHAIAPTEEFLKLRQEFHSIELVLENSSKYGLKPEKKVNNNLEKQISELNYKYQFVKNNKYWNYNQVYDLTINNKIYQISENDVLLNISSNIAKNACSTFVNKKNMIDYEIPNIDIEQMKRIVISFYTGVNPDFSNKVAFILSKTEFIKYDENIPSDQQRSVTTSEGIKLYYKNDLNSLVTLAHEVSHGITNLNDDLKLKDAKGVQSLSEVESMLTEELFLNYLKNINFQIKEKGSINEVRYLDDNIINDIIYDKYKSAVYTAYRAVDELEIKRILLTDRINNIDEKFIDDLSNSMNISKEEVIKKIDMFVSRYYPNDSQIHNYVGLTDYDLKNGQQLSNEARFLYADCLIEKLNSMNLDYVQKIDFYKNYLNNAQDMTFQEVLTLFDVDLTNPYSFSEEFINRFNALSNDF